MSRGIKIPVENYLGAHFCNCGSSVLATVPLTKFCLYMPTRLTAAAITLRHRYVCPSCRLQNAPLAGGQTTRYQHSGPRGNVGGDTNPESIPKDLGNYNGSQSRSHIGDLIQGLILSQKEKEKAINGELRNESLGKDEVHLAQKPFSSLFNLFVVTG